MTLMCKHVDMLQASTTKRTKSQKGSVLVEFALILPVFMLLLFGVISFSVALYDKTVLTMATREGARAGAKYVAGKTNDERGVIGRTTAATACQNSLISFGADMNPTFNYSINGDILTVSTSNVPYTGLYVFSNLTISAQSSMRLE